MELSDIPHVGLDASMGLHMTSVGPERTTATFEVAAHLLAATGSLHRGVVSAAVETVASVAGAAWFADRGRVVGVSNTTSHFATTSSGRVDVVAEPAGLLDSRQVWTVVLLAEDVLLARGTVELANVPDGGWL